MSEQRENAYERAADLYSQAIERGASALKVAGTGGWHIAPSTADGFHRRVMEIAEFLVAADAVPPGPCWQDSGFDGPSGSMFRCELLAGHAGAHECDRGMWGGKATWSNEEAQERTPDCSRPGLGTAGVTGAQPDEPASQAGRPASGGGS